METVKSFGTHYSLFHICIFAQGFTDETSFLVATRVMTRHYSSWTGKVGRFPAETRQTAPGPCLFFFGLSLKGKCHQKLFQLRTSRGSSIPAEQPDSLKIPFIFYSQKWKLLYSSLERKFRWCLVGSLLEGNLRSPKISNSTSTTSVKRARYSLLCYSGWIPKQLCNWCKIWLMKC